LAGVTAVAGSAFALLADFGADFDLADVGMTGMWAAEPA
jgi:hypothetical protein